jgi:hypothetical protein
MQYLKNLLCFCFIMTFAGLATAQSNLVLTDEIQTYSKLENVTASMYGKSELHLTDNTAPLPGSTVNIFSEDAWLFFDQIKPSIVAAQFLAQIRVMDLAAVMDKNVRVVQYQNGAVVIPHSPEYKPLLVFDGSAYTGASMSIGLYDYYRGSALLADMNDKISSFQLKRGYMATVAEEANGSGFSEVYVAQDGDITIENLPLELDNKISFVRVLPWRWANKKGWAGGDISAANALNCSWRYDWDNVATSTLDVEYIPMRHNLWWNAYSNINAKNSSTNVLAFNEPDKSDQANMTVAQALAEWPNLLQSGLRLGSPAPSDGGLAWLYDFIDRADKLNYRVDFVAVHYYKGGWTAQQYYNWLKDIHDRTGRPLWITEWNNGANWTCCEPSYDQQKQIIGNILAMLDTTSFVERYSIYNWVGDTRAMVSNFSPIELTPAGEVYRDDQAPMAYYDPRSLPLEPSTLEAEAVSSSSIKLIWTDNATNEIGFKIERQSGEEPFVEIARSGANTETFTDEKLMASTEYSYRIAAYNSLGSSDYSNIAIASTESGLGVLSQAGWKLRYVDSEEKVGENGAAVNAFDGNRNTFWHTQWQGANPVPPHEIQIDLGQNYNVAGFLYLTRQDGNYNGMIADYEFYTSTTGSGWGDPAAYGKWARSFSEKRVEFAERQARYIRLVAKSEVSGNAWSCVAELNVLISSGTGVKMLGENDSPPSNFVLYQNYPNPFNSSTSIRYAVPAISFVRLEIYDVMGHLVNTLIDRELPAGEYSLEWAGRNEQSLPVSSGLYFCRLMSGTHVKVIKLQLLK